MKKAVEVKRDYLLHKKAGAVTKNEPKIIWIKMISRYGRQFDKTLSHKGKFNRILEDLLADFSSHYVMDVNVAVNDSAYFAQNNKLNADGRIRFWTEVVG